MNEMFPFLSLRRSYVKELTKEDMERWVDPDPEGIKLNPLDYLAAELVEKILNYLNVVDLMDASLVSRDWYGLIANSVLCMKKVRLKCDRKLPVDYVISKYSMRKYQAAIVTHSNSQLYADTIDFLTTSNMRWKCLDISDTVFDTREQYVNFLKVIGPTIEKLVLINVSVKVCKDESPCDVEFPYLKSLEVKKCHGLINKSFGNAVNLKFLHINHGTDRSAAEVIRKLLRSSKQLKDLSIGGNVFCEIFEDLSDDIPFLLSLLSAHRFDTPEEHSNVQRNFNKFLTVHKNSLRCIYVDADLGKMVQDNIFYIMNLDSVTIMN